jgi:hypothetical protein
MVTVPSKWSSALISRSVSARLTCPHRMDCVANLTTLGRDMYPPYCEVR